MQTHILTPFLFGKMFGKEVNIHKQLEKFTNSIIFCKKLSIRRLIKKIFGEKFETPFVGTQNEVARILWLEATLKRIPAGNRILDAGAGELSQKKFCTHLNYVSQDFGRYNGLGNNKGLQMLSWDRTANWILFRILLPFHNLIPRLMPLCV